MPRLRPYSVVKLMFLAIAVILLITVPALSDPVPLGCGGTAKFSIIHTGHTECGSQFVGQADWERLWRLGWADGSHTNVEMFEIGVCYQPAFIWAYA